MKVHVETAHASRFHVSVLAPGGTAVHTIEFVSLRVMLSWLASWWVEVGAGGELFAPHPRYNRPLRPYTGYERASGGLRLNAYVGSAHLSGDEVLALISARPVKPNPHRPFRDGPVDGTGKRTRFRFFRRRIRTADSHREGAYPADDCGDVPAYRPARNRANLPSGRDDIARCQTRSWKATRRHQWRVVE
ncbi:hypothetical protein [Rhizobium sp. BK176]|uniref:hypothetical protein n=1 Tax=Rhizobium sp. BK176 TaxID=2587071 RepID=UPI00216A240A|nr:hypothetical protein [Rhizobium sp. BK176]MCS4090006.1 hypothetical protein [Rhizobium sp. BK176]